jgi:hypothetical protein
MPPRANKQPKKVKKQSKPKAHDVMQNLPRVKSLPRELMPVLGTRSLKPIFDREFTEFYNSQEILPALSLLDSEKQILQSPLETFVVTSTVSGETMYYLDILGKFPDSSGAVPINLFVKRVHLVEPIAYMEGKYDLPSEGALPRSERNWQNTLVKIHDPYNEAYIDALCSASMSRLVETNKSPHWCRFYGTFNSRVKNYSYNITSDISSIKYERWFDRNKRAGIFTIRTVGEDQDHKPLVEIVEEGGIIECDDLASLDSGSTNSGECNSDTPSTDDESEVQSLAEPPVRLSKMDNSDTENDNSDAESDFQNECEYFAEFKNFPVQVTFHERCDGTMDTLLDVEETTKDPNMIETKDARWSAWVYQVIAALSVAQHYYGFVHNDLHTNNIMWCGTGITHLYYKLDGVGSAKYMKVPTYGRLFKIIDFGRASFWLKNHDKLLITDSYSDGNDASGQYNCEPYYDKSEPVVNPNPSFDLCRLAISMFDALYLETPALKSPRITASVEEGRTAYETESELYNILWKWLTDDEGKNILRNPDDSERFPDFDLYKYIARHASKCVPREQAQLKYFETLFRVEKHHVPKEVSVWEIPLQ